MVKYKQVTQSQAQKEDKRRRIPTRGSVNGSEEGDVSLFSCVLSQVLRARMTSRQRLNGSVYARGRGRKRASVGIASGKQSSMSEEEEEEEGDEEEEA